mmetsp:Transcript_87070/g.221768  ORF Transcript_87070/g.221768 Transcript_87070/m.221768 type:complete len:219 (+) Transcript_87070:940-1596(+)
MTSGTSRRTRCCRCSQPPPSPWPATHTSGITRPTWTCPRFPGSGPGGGGLSEAEAARRRRWPWAGWHLQDLRTVEGLLQKKRTEAPRRTASGARGRAPRVPVAGAPRTGAAARARSTWTTSSPASHRGSGRFARSTASSQAFRHTTPACRPWKGRAPRQTPRRRTSAWCSASTTTSRCRAVLHVLATDHAPRNSSLRNSFLEYSEPCRDVEISRSTCF